MGSSCSFGQKVRAVSREAEKQRLDSKKTPFYSVFL